MLYLRFAGDSCLYAFYGATAAVFRALLDAPSNGKYFNQEIALWRQQAEFVRTCRLSRDTVAKWFGADFRVPDTLTLRRIAERTGVSLDWLMLGRGEMDWPPPTEGAKAELFEAVKRQLARSYTRAPVMDEAAVGILEELGADGLWNEVTAGIEDVRELYFRIGLRARLGRPMLKAAIEKGSK